MPAELKVLKVGQIIVAIDGTRALADPSEHSAVSYERSGGLIQEVEQEVKQLMEKAEKRDKTPLEDGEPAAPQSAGQDRSFDRPRKNIAA